MRRFLAAALEMLSLWISPPPPLPGRWWSVLWCEGFDPSRRKGKRVRGESVEMGMADSESQARSVMLEDGPGEWKIHGNRGLILVMDPEENVIAFCQRPPPDAMSMRRADYRSRN